MFLVYLDEWEESVKRKEGFDKSQKILMMLSAETRQGLRLTGKTCLRALIFEEHPSFSDVIVELVQYAFTIPGVSVFLRNRVCQDPLESFFGQQQQRGRADENPSVSEFIRNTQALRVISTTCNTI